MSRDVRRALKENKDLIGVRRNLCLTIPTRFHVYIACKKEVAARSQLPRYS
jgi:hypothetical protein